MTLPIPIVFAAFKFHELRMNIQMMDKNYHVSLALMVEVSLVVVFFSRKMSALVVVVKLLHWLNEQVYFDFC